MPLFLLGNVPIRYRSKDLRNFFSEYVEAKAFICFHYRHRKVCENVSSFIEREGTKCPSINLKFLCSFFELKEEFFEKFFLKYNNSIWFNFKNEYDHTERVLLLPINNGDSIAHIKNLIEFKPPFKVLPQGNVGTPLEFFKQSITNCQMPSNILKRLGICDSLLVTKCNNIYGKVPLNYSSTFGENISGINLLKLKQDEGPINFSKINKKTLYNLINADGTEIEEWDRYESLYNDIDEQQRTKPRLYEEEMEVVWEKGGSGLVFHTDDIIWKSHEGKTDFDEETANDWDVDTEIYETSDLEQDHLLENTPEGQLLKMKIMKNLKTGISSSNLHPPQSFKVSKFAISLMKKYGWRDGESLGKNSQGIKSAIVADYRRPNDKSGIGTLTTNYDDDEIDITTLKAYHQMKKFNKPKKHIISTKFDLIIDNDDNRTNSSTVTGTTPWRSESPTHIKYLN